MTVYYKVLRDGNACHGGNLDYTPYFPKGKRPGKWLPPVPSVIPCVQGYHAATEEQLPDWLAGGNQIWVVEFKSRPMDADDKVVGSQMRLVRRVEHAERIGVVGVIDCDMERIDEGIWIMTGGVLQRATGNSTIKRIDGNSTIECATGNSTIELATGNSTIKRIDGNSTIEWATGNSTIELATGNSTIECATDNSTIECATDNSTIECATGNSTIKRIDGNSTIKRTDGNSTIEWATGNSTTILWGLHCRILALTHRAVVIDRAYSTLGVFTADSIGRGDAE